MKLTLLFAAIALQAFATSTYTHTVTPEEDGLSSLTISGADHGMNSTHIAVDVHDENHVKVPTGSYSYSVDGSSFDVTLNFSPSLYTGAKITLIGPFTGSNTTASTDFQLTVVTGEARVCYVCTAGSPAQRGLNSRVYLMETPSKFTWTYGPQYDATVMRVYILDSVMVFGLTGTSGVWGSPAAVGPHTRVTFGITDYPAGSVHLGYSTWNGSAWGTVTDNRPMEFQ